MYCPICGKELTKRGEEEYYCPNCEEIIIPSVASLFHKINKTEFKDTFSSDLPNAKGNIKSALLFALIPTIIFLIGLYSGLTDEKPSVFWIIVWILLYLPWLIGAASLYYSDIRERQRDADKEQYWEMQRKLNSQWKTQVSDYKENLIRCVENGVRKLFAEKKQAYPWMAQQFADYLYMFDVRIASMLEHKSHPALKAAENVRVLSKEKRDLQKALKMAQYQLNYYESVFPWLEEFKEVDPMEASELSDAFNRDDEAAFLKNWLSPEEYKKLSPAKRNQKALDGYMNSSRKTNWQAGIDYERYIGYLYELDGWTVDYCGANNGLEDMGRDLIATKGDQILIIQCKRWSKEKTIHEKHIFQLYGTLIEYEITTGKAAQGHFISTTDLSEIALKCAEKLDIRVSNMQMAKYPEYPVIKCHLTLDGQKIYHLPFDQQYDRIKNLHDNRLMYAYTVAEAEKKGFRRAFKWKGNIE